MTKMRIITVLFTLSFIFFSTLSTAHTNEKSAAQLYLLEDNKYTLTISLDVLNILNKELAINGTDIEVIFHLKYLSLTESRNLLAKFKKKLSEQSKVIFDGKEQSLSELSGFSVAQLRAFTRPSATLSEYSVQLYASGTMPEDTKEVKLRFAEILGDVILTVSKPSKALIIENTTSKGFSTSQTLLANQSFPSLNTFVEYLEQGFVHIIPKGLDHILFVLALFLFTRKTSTLLWQISAFTLAHTITLALGIFQIVTLPSSIVEPIIALSIVYVAIENIYLQKLSKWRLPMIFAFGLLHGLGFASVLLELGLASNQYVLSLVSFNIGVELGQLSVILIAFILTFWCVNKAWYRSRVVIPTSIAIALMASYWFVERVL